MIISLIAAVGKNNVIGTDNKLPWKLSADLKRFKAITSGKPVIMGRKTFESIGKPLPNRTNIIISSHPIPGIKEVPIPGIESVIAVQSFDAAIGVAKKSPGNDEIFVIGGGQI